MNSFYVLLMTFVLIFTHAPTIRADTIMNYRDNKKNMSFTGNFSTVNDMFDFKTDIITAQYDDRSMTSSFWPFGKKDDSGSSEIKRKSSRKAFFLSFLLPGLGEAYVGSKRSFLFLGVEAVAWWIYINNTNKGNDIETDFHRFADTYWHYTDTEDSQGNDLDFNYWEWLQAHFRQIGFQDTIDPHNYALIDSLLEETVKNSKSSIFGYSVHTLPSKKTQQYYEMIGKYPQFVYGWEDIDDKTLNPTVRDENGNIYYHEGVENIKSPSRNKYEDMRDDSNNKLKAGQSGIHLMLINRMLSAIDAARLAYHHNEKIDSELSMVRIRLEQKQIIDHKVPMIVVTKKF